MQVNSDQRGGGTGIIGERREGCRRTCIKDPWTKPVVGRQRTECWREGWAGQGGAMGENGTPIIEK